MDEKSSALRNAISLNMIHLFLERKKACGACLS
jgi:hypothetical protein